jgi:hypothetical protein
MKLGMMFGLPGRAWSKVASELQGYDVQFDNRKM